MRLAAAGLACAAAIAWAQGPQEFADRAPLALPAKAPLYRVALPEAAYRDARPDLADLRVFNAHGDAVPIALAQEPGASRETPPPVDLPAFAVSSLDAARIASQVSVRLADGTLVSVGEHRGTRPPAPAAGYILDASAVKQPVQALHLEWETMPAQGIVHVRVEGSDDLRTWRPLAGPVALVHMEQDGRKLEQPRVPLPVVKDKYLRVSAVDAPFALRVARAELEDRLRPAERVVKRVPGRAGAKPGEAVFDLGARLPVEALRLVPGEANSVIPAAFLVRDTADATPGWVAQGTFYRLTRDGAEIASEPAQIRRRAARYWIARADPDKGGLGATLPELEVHWRPAQVVFVARGDEPFTLAFGNREARSALLPVSSLMPGHEPHAEMALPEARAGALSRTPSARDAWPEWLQDASPRKLALWALLVGAVVLLGFMAWRLHRSAQP
ncbi:MAG: DUF3999 domain-containing protein [Betaproteobacteria bacterium]